MLVASARKSSWARWAMSWRLTEVWTVKSKSSRVLTRREAGRLDPCRAAVAVAGAHLLGEHRGQIGLVVPALVPGPLRRAGRTRP